MGDIAMDAPNFNTFYAAFLTVFQVLFILFDMWSTPGSVNTAFVSASLASTVPTSAKRRLNCHHCIDPDLGELGRNHV